MSEYKPTAPEAIRDILKYVSGDADDGELDAWCDGDQLSEYTLEAWRVALKDADTFLSEKAFRQERLDVPEDKLCSYCKHCGNTLFRVFTDAQERVVERLECAECGRETVVARVNVEAGDMSWLTR